MQVGIPKESVAGETRVAATPESVRKLAALGLKVLIESGAGRTAHYPDDAYRAAGAEVVTAAQALAADIVFKVRRPNGDEIKAMRSGAVLVCLVELCEDDGTLAALAKAGVSAFALERIPRISRAQAMDALSSQSNIGGYRAVIEAVRLYGRFFPMMMTAAGSAKPARVVVLGAGVAGLQAIATARRLGAQVSAYDVRPEVKEQVMSLGARFIELDVGESGAGTGGYAKELSAEAQRRQIEQLSAELKKADIIISTALIPCRPAPRLITEDAVQGMAPGSVIVDMAAANGGNCALTEPDQTVVKHGVTICGITNFPALMPTDASGFYARNLLNFVALVVAADGGRLALKPFMEDEITAASLLTHGGEVVAKKR